MTATKSVYEVSRPTARELLVRAGGAEHDLHSVTSKEPANRGTVRVTCSCGSIFVVKVDEESAAALRNVPVVS